MKRIIRGLFLLIATASPVAAWDEATFASVPAIGNLTPEQEDKREMSLARQQADRAVRERLIPAAEKVTDANLQVVGTITYREAYSGTYMLMGEVRNSGSVTYCFVKIALDLRDAANVSLATDWTYVTGSNLTLDLIDLETDTCLKPFETGFFGEYITVDMNRVTRILYETEGDATDTSTPDARIDLVGGINAANSYGEAKLSGTLKNNGIVSATFCKINLAPKRSDGALLDVDLTYVDGSTIGGSDTGLTVGQSGPFDTYTDAPFSSYSFTTYKTAWDDYGVAPACTFTTSPQSANFTSSGGTGTANVNASASTCSWAASPSTSWITVTSGQTGAGSGQVGYRVAANTSTQLRTGTITVGGAVFTITQAGLSCTYSLSPTSATVPAAGGNGTFTVSTQSGCSFTPSVNVPWLSATWNGAQVTYTAQPNTSTDSRSGAITVSGQVFTVNQLGVDPPDEDYVYWVAGIAKTSGAGGSAWMSSLTILNQSSDQAEVTIELLRTSSTHSAVATLAPGAITEWADVVGEVFGLASAESSLIRMASNVALLVAARTYNSTAAGTFGQLMPGFTTEDGFGFDEPAYLPGLKKTTSFRTNVGIVNLSPYPCEARVSLFGEGGEQLGASVEVSVPGERFVQVNRIFDAAGAGESTVAYATVTPGTLFDPCEMWAFASVVDEGTGDPTTIVWGGE